MEIQFSERNSQDASGTRPFGQPLYIGPQIENGNGVDMIQSHSNPLRGKLSPRVSPTPKKGIKSKSKN